MWHSERVPLSSGWWLKLLPSYRSEKMWILEVKCELLWCGGAAAESSSKLINGSSRGKDTDILSLQQHYLKLQGLKKTHDSHQEISICSFSNSDFYKSHIVIYESIIPAVYVAVIDLFMKTAIVLRSVTGSQTTEQLQVEVIVLWMQWNQNPADQKEKQSSH